MATSGAKRAGFVPRRPRLVTVVKGDSFPTFGFNLHGLKGRPGQVIKNVDEKGAAFQCGLFPGDCILAVNGESVIGETHSMVVGRIRALPDRVIILVCDAESQEYYNSKGIPISEDDAIRMSNEDGPMTREDQKTMAAKALYGKAEAAAVAPAIKDSALDIPEVHSYGPKRKESKRDQAKKGGSWAEKMAAFGNL
eukprot:scpid75598/ scgid32424/ Na(+)/H(+) exchange regulatory cofactor NHE-RF1; Ezrin-radixin-moesin-binding phosphoprotein 50; Regulatory cofactor of Na(+)/H(+) exchanger; Sodium-hydrogen exchanger regulatory factor 1; Solute carrier family 9 isoform A3 regulatory factor 1